MAIIHEAYLFKPSDFARDILPYAKALATGSDGEGEKVLLNTLIERFENSSRTSWLAIEYGGWDVRTLYEELAEAERGGRLNVGWLLVFMIYGYMHPVPSQLGLGGHWSLMEKVLRHPLGWHASDTSSLIHGHSFAYFAQLWIAGELSTIDNHPPKLDCWEHVTTGTTAAQIGWLDYPDVRRFFDRLTKEGSKLPNVKTSQDASSIKQVYDDTLQMLRSANEAKCGLCIITSG